MSSPSQRRPARRPVHRAATPGRKNATRPPSSSPRPASSSRAEHLPFGAIVITARQIQEGAVSQRARRH
ncbi:MAG: hypothetical protein MZW92_64505 [Comamonadaceae bacterium]|nr:hypothetical protein [Comamonadaceae bacterium]